MVVEYGEIAEMNQIPPRYEMPESIRKLTLMFNLVTYPGMQDWAIEAADSQILDGLLNSYHDPAFTDDDQFALMSLILASLDDAKQEKRDIRSALSRTKDILAKNASLHAYTMAYWACDETDDPDSQFLITPDVRSVWASVKGTILD